MTVRIVFLHEGTSDAGLATHIESLALDLDIEVTITDPDFGRLSNRVGTSVHDKLAAVHREGGAYDLIVVHRDADKQGVDARVGEIRAAVRSVAETTAVAPVIPVRMTEAWLLTDEAAIRRVAGNPRGTNMLNLPKVRRLEDIADPKNLLDDVLTTASELTGRRLKLFRSRFSQHRRQLLERLDRQGAVASLPSWQRFVADLQTALTSIDN